MDLSLLEAIKKVANVSPGRLISILSVAEGMGLSPPISVIKLIRKIFTPEWPLGDGDYRAGNIIVSDVPVSPMSWLPSPPTTTHAVIYYPASIEGTNVTPSSGGPFPLLIFGHAFRSRRGNEVCDGAPEDTTQDFRQYSGILSHLARWGFITISPDLSWIGTPDPDSFAQILQASLQYIVNENSREGSLLKDNIDTSTFGVMGHSTGGGGAILLSEMEDIPVAIKIIGLIAPALLAREGWNLGKPALVIKGTMDTGFDGVHNGPVNIYNSAGPPKHFVEICGANHFGYTDSIFIKPPNDTSASITQADQQKFAKAYLIAFLSRYLKNLPVMEDYLTGIRPIEGIETCCNTLNRASCSS